MILINLAYGAANLFHKLLTEIRFIGGTILPLQRLRNSGVVFRSHFPQVGHFSPLDRAGVGYIKDIFQPGPAAAILMNESDALGTGLHPPPHGFIP